MNAKLALQKIRQGIKDLNEEKRKSGGHLTSNSQGFLDGLIWAESLLLSTNKPRSNSKPKWKR